MLKALNKPQIIYVGKEFVLLLSFGGFQIPVHAFLLILGGFAPAASTFIATKNKLAIKILTGSSEAEHLVKTYYTAATSEESLSHFLLLK